MGHITKADFHFSHRHLFVVCYYDGKFMRSDKLKGHTAALHKGMEPRALKPGEKPLKPYNEHWDEIAEGMGQRKAVSESPEVALSDVQKFSLAKSKA